MAAVSTTGNAISVDFHLCLHDFGILKRLRFLSGPNVLLILWRSSDIPPRGWIKLDCDGASTSPLDILACGSIARDHGGSFLGVYASYLGVSNSLTVEFSGAMLAIEFANEKN